MNDQSEINRRRMLLRTVGGAAAAISIPYLKAHAADDQKPAATASAHGLTQPEPTSWPSFRGSADQRGVTKSSLSADPKVAWEVASPDGWIAAAAIAGPHVYAPALEGFLYCFDRQTGSVIWKYRSLDDPDPKEFAPGFKATPLITADAVFVGDEDGVLHALNRGTGQLLWKFATGGEIAGSVGIFEDRLLLASHDSFLYCLSMSGEEIWKFQTNDRINCSPAIVDNFTFLAGCDEHLRVIDVKSGTQVRDIPLGSFLIASPAIVNDQLYVGTHTGEIVSVNWKTGEVTWQYKGPREMPYHASAAVTDSLVLVGGHDKHLHAVSRHDGTVRWTFPTRARIESSAVVVDKRVFFGSGDGNIYGLSLDDGTEVWKFNAGKPVNAGIAIGNGCLVAGEDTTNGKLRCFV